MPPRSRSVPSISRLESPTASRGSSPRRSLGSPGASPRLQPLESPPRIAPLAPSSSPGRRPPRPPHVLPSSWKTDVGGLPSVSRSSSMKLEPLDGMNAGHLDPSSGDSNEEDGSEGTDDDVDEDDLDDDSVDGDHDETIDDVHAKDAQVEFCHGQKLDKEGIEQPSAVEFVDCMPGSQIVDHPDNLECLDSGNQDPVAKLARAKSPSASTNRQAASAAQKRSASHDTRKRSPLRSSSRDRTQKKLENEAGVFLQNSTSAPQLLQADDRFENSTIPEASLSAPFEVTRPVTGKARTKFKGIKQTKTLSFDSVYGAIRAVLTVGDHVWTADWRGNIEVRDRTKVEKILHTIPSSGLVWCLCVVAPGLVAAGMDSTPSIQILDAATKEPLAGLMGHVGGVSCLAYEGQVLAGDGGQVSESRPGRFWSGSNDFTIGCWEVEQIPEGKKSKTKHKHKDLQNPPAVGEVRLSPSTPKGCTVVVRRTGTLHGHKGGVQCLLRIGPVLWSGGAEGHLRLWRTSDGTSLAVVTNATDRGASIVNLALVRGRVWACCGDGCVREWSVGGLQAPLRCLRVLRLSNGEGSADNCPRSCIPIGNHVWIAGSKPDISIFDGGSFEQLAALPAHSKYISSMLLVDRVETRTVWSTSLGDRKLKVWRHELRGDQCADANELQAANICYAEECDALRQAAEGWQQRQDEQNQKIEELEIALQKEREERLAQEERLAELLEAERRRREAVEAHLGEERRKRGETDEALRDECGKRGKLEGEVENLLARLHALEQDLAGERSFREKLEKQLAKECELRGEGELALKAETDGRKRLQTEADTLLARLSRLEEEMNRELRFREKLESQLSEERRLRDDTDSALLAEKDGRKRLQSEADALLERLAKLESELQMSRDRAAAEETERLAAEAEGKRAAAEAEALRLEMDAREAERLRALELCEQMKLRYAQLDVFKLDIIARELKKTDQGLESLRREGRDISEALKGRHGGEGDRERALNESLHLIQHAADLRAHVRDIIERCLSETQKLHIGSAVVDNLAAGELKDGGVLKGIVDAKNITAAGDLGQEHGKSRAARLRQGDEVRREAGHRLATPPPSNYTHHE